MRQPTLSSGRPKGNNIRGRRTSKWPSYCVVIKNSSRKAKYFLRKMENQQIFRAKVVYRPPLPERRVCGRRQFSVGFNPDLAIGTIYLFIYLYYGSQRASNNKRMAIAFCYCYLAEIVNRKIRGAIVLAEWIC